MKPNLKATRDSLLSGGTAIAIAQVLTDHGIDVGTAILVALAGTFIVARGYRVLRKRWPWLSEFDPAAE